MNILIIILLFLFPLIFSIVEAAEKNACPSNFCGSFSLDYPFKLPDSQPQNDCNYMNLTCNSTLGLGTPVLNLPYTGDFYVRYIGYYDPYIQLYDPGSCLMSRLMKNLNLSSSPFKAKAHQNYTFYTCPINSLVEEYYVLPIDCLSNSTNSTVATSLVAPELMREYGCAVIGSWLLPVLGPGQFEFDGVNGDLYLTWNSTTCEACEEANLDTGGSTGNSWEKFAESHFFVPFFTAMAFVVVICILKVLKCIGRNEVDADSQEAEESTVAAPGFAAGGGLDESKINCCTELVVFSESRVNAGLDSNSISSSCAICLDNYKPSEIVRSIAKCEHCFHAECIELWLRKNSTCPICRTMLAAAADHALL